MMSKRFGKLNWMTALVAGVFLLGMTTSVHAQFSTINQIGGIEVNAEGVLQEVPATMKAEARQQVLDNCR